jgi:hypothetical protein
MRISSKPDQKSTTTYMLKQWTLVKPLPLAARLLRHAPNENGSALVARNQGQESSLVSVGVDRRRSWMRRAERCGMRARCHGSKLGFVEMGNEDGERVARTRTGKEEDDRGRAELVQPDHLNDRTQAGRGKNVSLLRFLSPDCYFSLL